MHSEKISNNAEAVDAFPKITVVMPSYNQGQFLEQAIQSVLNQKYSNLEFMVFDGGSDDNSVAIIEKYSAHISYWQSQSDGGQAAALARGFSMASGDIHCWLNSDDIFLPSTLNHIAQQFDKFSQVDFIYGNRRVIDTLGNVIDEHQWPSFLTRYHWALGQPMAQECCFWRSHLYEKVGGINPDLYFIMDYDLFFRMWRVGRFKKTSLFLGCIRFHDDSKNSKSQSIMRDEMERALIKYKLKKPGFFMSRIINRLNRIQVYLESRADSYTSGS